ncbi:MAG: histidinol-phosphate transaminase [Bilophila sp.]
MSSIPIRSLVRAFKPYTAGLSINEIRETYGLERVIKFASNENPLGTSPLAQKALRDHAGLAFRYPQAGNPRLVTALAAHHNVSPARVVVGNGSDEIIDLLFRVCAEPGIQNAVAFKPCFGIYSTQSALCGVTLRQTPLNLDFSFPIDDLLQLVDANTRLVFITTPDNPSGYTAPVADLIRLAHALPDTCLLVVDEAYMDFTDDEGAHSLLPTLTDFPNVAILRTFSKSFGMAGLRLGYGILPETIADHMWRVRLPFSVNLMAEEAALAALKDSDFRTETLRVIREGRAFLTTELTNLGLHVTPSQANFLMFEVPLSQPSHTSHPSKPTHTAATLFEALLKQGLILRPLNGYGLPNHLRVSVGTAEENHLLIQTLRHLLA